MTTSPSSSPKSLPCVAPRRCLPAWPGSSWRVVVADDCPEDRADVRRQLLCGSERRYEFVEADTAEATIRAVLDAPRGPPDCLVLDYHLPDADALGVLAALAVPGGGCVCPVVVLTGADENTTGGDVLRAGAQDFLGKGWMTAQSVTRAVENAIERYRMTQELRDREAALRRSEERYRLLADALPHMTWVTRRDHSFEYVNRMLTAYTGSTLEELGTEGWETLLHPDDCERLWAELSGPLERQEPHEAEHRLRWHDGTYRWVLSRAVPMMDASGDMERWVGTTTDIDARKRAEEALQRSEQALKDADRRKDEFLATLAHELRNPLAPLRTGLEILRRHHREVEDAAVKHAQEMMERQLGHLVRLVDDLLDVSRIRRGMVELRPERVRVGTVLEHGVELGRPLLEAAGHTLAVEAPDASVWVNGDLTRLAQVVGNLLNNAAKYTPHGGRIRLSCEVEGREVVIRVTDDGIGIAAEMLPRVFDLFAQVDRTIHRAQGGLGIGLSLVRQLVAMHGGTIAAESPGIGWGSTFTVRLPLAPAITAASTRTAPPPEPASSSPSHHRVLVVDDNVDGAETLAMLLELSGHEATTAGSGPAALEVARAWHPELVFLDIGLPGMDGYEVARRLRTDPATAGLVLVALTGWGSEEDKRRSKAAGFDLHLIKPVGPEVVADVLARLTTHGHGAEGLAAPS